MGSKKRKAVKVKAQKFIYKIPKLFECPFCMVADGVKITIDKKRRKADLKCRRCGHQEREIKVTPLAEPIDIYDDFMDRCRDANAKFNPAPVHLDEAEQQRLIDEFRMQGDGGSFVTDDGDNTSASSGSDLEDEE